MGRQRLHAKKQPQRLVPCMPPLMEIETKPLNRSLGDTRFGGSACEEVVKNYFLSRHINIAEPHVDEGVDLLIEKPEGWVRGQVKKVVYQLGLDNGIFKRYGTKIYRNRFNFNYQGGGLTAPHLKNGRNQKSPKDFDYFYHVLLTPYRQLIWETPVNMIPLRENGDFIYGKAINLTTEGWVRKKAEIDYRKLLIYEHYDPIVFKTHTNFFLKPEQPTLESFFN